MVSSGAGCDGAVSQTCESEPPTSAQCAGSKSRCRRNEVRNAGKLLSCHFLAAAFTASGYASPRNVKHRKEGQEMPPSQPSGLLFQSRVPPALGCRTDRSRTAWMRLKSDDVLAGFLIPRLPPGSRGHCVHPPVLMRMFVSILWSS